MSNAANGTAFIVKTLAGIQRELWAYTGMTPNYDLAASLNSKYNVFPGVAPTALPTLKYFGIGVNGCHNVNNSNLSDPNPILMTDMDLYMPIPFRCVPVEQDLSPADRQQYRMRVRENIGGNDYYSYYLKCLTYVDNAVKLSVTNPTNQLETPYNIDYGNLNPSVPVTDINGIITAAVTEVNVSVTGSMPLSGAEVVEAVSVKFGGDLRYARISELGIYSGQDQTVTGHDVNNNEFNYVEAILAQLELKRTSLGDDFSNTTRAETYTIRLGSGDLLLIG